MQKIYSKIWLEGCEQLVESSVWYQSVRPKNPVVVKLMDEIYSRKLHWSAEKVEYYCICFVEWHFQDFWSTMLSTPQTFMNFKIYIYIYTHQYHINKDLELLSNSKHFLKITCFFWCHVKWTWTSTRPEGIPCQVYNCNIHKNKNTPSPKFRFWLYNMNILPYQAP